MSDVVVRNAEISRRRVVQGALWAAPVVAIATAIPAAATSNGPGAAQFGSGAAFQVVNARPMRYIFSGLQLQHQGGGSITNLRVTITSVRGLRTNPAPVVTGAGWSLLSGSSNQFVFIYGGEITGGATPALGIEFTQHDNSGNVSAFTVTATADTNGGTNNVTAVWSG